MIKYKLIKEYPGSPEIGTVVEKESKIKSDTSYYYREGEKRWCIFNHHVEDNPEYWKKINEYTWYIVSEDDYKQFDTVLFKKWNVYEIETYEEPTLFRGFKTREQAESFILYNKPCLSYNDVIKMFSTSSDFRGDGFSFYMTERSLTEFVKTKL